LEETETDQGRVAIAYSTTLDAARMSLALEASLVDVDENGTHRIKPQHSVPLPTCCTRFVRWLCCCFSCFTKHAVLEEKRREYVSLKESIEGLYGAHFRQNFTLDDAFGSHACSLEALACV
jgi:hypothetical protein